ncbi:PucR family transcriptional regulator ligand-binding domain-containing protein [Nonomuraea sp. ZG12]|uniref:PucR family transcriptional regulator n=1 Tax=Nonomuraea sp. ZG12 TaxID=3452207 RepID=UPI003F8C1705
MAPSLRTVVRRMRLVPVAGGLDSVVRWVAVSELEDPAPFLEGDELLLTTGMRLGDDFPGYVARLVARGVAGLGFGVGLFHEEIPAGLVTAAAEAGLPLLEVPRETPFIAIGKLVSELLAAEQYDEITRAFAAQGRLTRAALRPEGMHAVIDRLAKETGGWAILLDESGQVRHATPGAEAAVVTAEITRFLTAGRTADPPPGAGSVGTLGAVGEAGAASGEGTATAGDKAGEAGATDSAGMAGSAGAVGTVGAAGMSDVPGTAAVRAGVTSGTVGPGLGVTSAVGASGVRVAAGAQASAGVRGSGRRFPASLALAGPGEHIVVQPLGGGVRPRGFFAVGVARAFSPVAHTVVNAAGSLLTLALEQGGAQLEAERRLRDAVLRLLLSGAPGAEGEARAVLGPVGRRLPEEPFVVLAVGEEALEQVEAVAFAARLGPEAGAALPEVRSDERPGEGPASAGERRAGGDLATGAERAGGGLAKGAERAGDGAATGAGRRAGVVVLVGEQAGRQVAGLVGGGVGVSSPCGYQGLRAGVDQACQAYGAGRGGVVLFGELAGQGLMALLEPAAARAFSAARLAPLVAYGPRADLIASLRAYLDSNGHWDAAAQRLGVHRHTLRYRMKRVTELLGCDLDDPGVRAELWFALEAARR